MAPFKPLPPVEYIRELLDYDPETGEFRWRVARRSPAGSLAGTTNRSRHCQIKVDGRLLRAHRLAWYVTYGVDPGELEVDHINGDPADNRLCNLRLATHAENSRNRRKHVCRADGLKGAYWHKGTGRWIAQVTKDGTHHWLGSYDTPEEAHAAYVAAANELHGEFARAA